ncbi:MAG: HmuY family protein [Ferruginibacter sp.]
MKLRLIKDVLTVIAFIGIIASCSKKDAPLPDNLASFEVSEQGIAETESNVAIKVKLSRATDRDIAIAISLTATTGVDYATDYTTSPAATSNNIVLTILSGSNEGTITLTKTAGALFYADDQIVFKILSSASPVIIGDTKEITLKFSEIVSTGTSLVGDGGGATYGNKIFFDLSANSQTAVQRTKWDLGFYSDASDWRVILNSSTAMMAKQINKNDLTTVTATDTIGFSSDVIFNQSAPTTTSLAYIDYPDGDLTRTAIAAVSVNDADNKVYIINRGTGIGSPAPLRGWKKIRIIRNASGGYTLQHADIASTTFTSIDIPKNTTHFFNYISFETGLVDVEPSAKKWDIAWTYFANATNFGGGEVPYTFQDFILQNRNVQIAKVLTSAISYEAFAEADIAAQTFVSKQNGIGSDWRAGGGPSTAPSVRTDRFYIIKDSDNNYYKLRFTDMTQAGERGYPAFEYVLVKRG